MKTFKEYFLSEGKTSKASSHADEFMKSVNHDTKKIFNLKVKILMDAYWELFSKDANRDIIKTDIQSSEEKPLKAYKEDNIYTIKGKKFDFQIPEKYITEIK